MYDFRLICSLLFLSINITNFSFRYAALLPRSVQEHSFYRRSVLDLTTASHDDSAFRPLPSFNHSAVTISSVCSLPTRSSNRTLRLHSPPYLPEKRNRLSRQRAKSTDDALDAAAASRDARRRIEPVGRRLRVPTSRLHAAATPVPP